MIIINESDLEMSEHIKTQKKKYFWIIKNSDILKNLPLILSL